uniref:Exportin-5 C-terminal domain-containing protein n=1 Tax=Tetranychus urticae TaxID=32264 RepID=T1JUD3_TETUR
MNVKRKNSNASMKKALKAEIDHYVPKTIEAVDTIRRGILDKNQMREAHMVIEALNNNPNVDLTIKIAYKLITFSGNEDLTPSVKHFGFQLVENCIKYKWDEISNPTKDEIKVFLQKMVCETLVGKDLKLIKEGISKCVVELMKREWPVNWPHLTDFMLSSKLNDRVLMVMGRLSEELGIFCSPSKGTDIDPARHREQLRIIKQATDCLLTCLFRKVPEKDCLIIMKLFCPKNVTSIFKCVDLARPKINVNNFSNDHFTLAKRVFSVVTMMGQTAIQLHSLKQVPTETWQIYIQKMHSLFCIDNYILNAFVLQFWRDLAKSKELQSLINASLITSMLSFICTKLFKRPFGDPSIRMEFGDEEDYDVFYIKFKAELVDLVRSLTVYREDICFNFASILLMTTQMKRENASIAEWKITASILGAVCNHLTDVSLHHQQGSPLLDVLVKSDESDVAVEILCCQISCAIALTIFIPHSLSSDPSLIDTLLEKIFKMAGYELPGENSDNRSNSVRNLRHIACSLFIRITRRYSAILLPAFDQLKDRIHATFAVNIEASQNEICALNEGLMILSNCFEDPAQQTLFVNELLEPIKWILDCDLTPVTFISSVGLDTSPCDFDFKRQTRAQLMHVISTLLGLLKRVRKKEVLHAPVMAMMNPLCKLLSHLNSLWNQEMMMICHADYRSTVFAPITERDYLTFLEILGTSHEDNEDCNPSKSPALRMQKFFLNFQDYCYSAIGAAYSLITPELYLEFNNITLAVAGFENLPDMMLRRVIRVFLKPFFKNFRFNDIDDFEKTFSPFVKQVLPVLFTRIDISMKIICERECIEEKTDIRREIVEEKASRDLALDFVSILRCLILSSKSNRKPENLIDEDDFDSRETDEQNNKPVEQSASYLGDYLIKNLPSIITQICFQCLNWPDSTVSWKAGSLCEVVLARLIEHAMVRNPSDCLFLLENICKALGYFGEYELNRGICLQLISTIYESLILPMKFNSVKHDLIKLSDGNIEKWVQFEKKWIRNPPKTKNVQKSKREALEELLDPIIGKSLSKIGRNPQDKGGNSISTPRRKKTTDVFNDKTLYFYELFR